VSAYLVGDVNGDGKADLVVVLGSTVLVNLSTGTAFGAPVAWFNGPQPAGTQQIYLANVDTVPVLPAKPTADLVFIGTAATSGAATVTVRASNGTLFGANTTWSTDSIVGINGVADMNNDGRADLVTSPGTPNNIYVRLSSGTTFAAGAGTSWGAATGINMRAIDVTGDGKADLVDPTTTTVRVAGTGTFSAATAWAATGLTGPQGAIFGNIDGTGGNDVIGGSNTTNIQVRLSNNTTGFVAANGFYEPFSFATKRYYMAGTVPVAVIDAANIGYHWLAGDTQGTTSLDVPDASGTAGITYQRYKPYGQQRGGDTITTTDHGFLGQIEDPTGLTYLNNRYYDPTTARFISVDPLVDMTRDAYGYAGNNPITMSDPTGLVADGGRNWKDTGADRNMPDEIVQARNNLLNGAGRAQNGSSSTADNQAIEILVHLWYAESAASTGECDARLFDCVPYGLSGHCEGAVSASGKAVCSFYGGFNYGELTPRQSLGQMVMEMGAAFPIASLGSGSIARSGGIPAGFKGAQGLMSPPNGSKMSANSALSSAEEFLGAGYQEPVPGSGRYVSSDGTRAVRMGTGDLTGHGGKDLPHMNFETLQLNPSTGRMQVVVNSHVYLTDGV
jgi:RHS repeat-associated protein